VMDNQHNYFWGRLFSTFRNEWVNGANGVISAAYKCACILILINTRISTLSKKR
jgi:hypothetical protein